MKSKNSNDHLMPYVVYAALEIDIGILKVNNVLDTLGFIVLRYPY